MFVCEICTELLNHDEDVSAIPCGHVFHLKCVKDWAKIRKVCPKCRVDFDPKRVIQKLYLDRLEGTVKDDGVDMYNKIEVLESSLMVKDTEISKLVRQKQQLETELSVKEIQKMELQDQLEGKRFEVTSLQNELSKMRDEAKDIEDEQSSDSATPTKDKRGLVTKLRHAICQREKEIAQLATDNEQLVDKLKLSDANLEEEKNKLYFVKRALVRVDRSAIFNTGFNHQDDSHRTVSIHASNSMYQLRDSYLNNSPPTVAQAFASPENAAIGRPRRGSKRCLCADDVKEKVAGPVAAKARNGNMTTNTPKRTPKRPRRANSK